MDLKSRSLNKINDMVIVDLNKGQITKDSSANLLELQEQALLKRINSSNQNLVSEIEGVFHDQKKTKIKEISFESEASSGRWDALMLNPEKNKKQLDSEFRSLQQENQVLTKKYNELEDQLEKLKIANAKEIRELGENIYEKLDGLEKEMSRIREEKILAVKQVEDLEEQLQLKSLELEKVKVLTLEDRKKFEKQSNKLQNSMELVNNLLQQKQQLNEKISEANKKLEELQISNSIEAEKIKLKNKFDELESFIKQAKCQDVSSKKESKTKKESRPKKEKAKKK